MSAYTTHSKASKEDLGFQKVILTVGVSLMALKFAAWYVTSSVSILTDAFESIVNVVAACIGLYALYLSAKPRDRDHPFGHGKAETISSSIEGAMICVAGLIIILEASDRIINPVTVRKMDVGLLIVAFAAVTNFVVGYSAIKKGRKNRSQALVGAGKHLCSDTYSSAGIIIGLLLMLGVDSLGYDAMWLDGLIAALFGMIILFTGARVVKESMDAAMDKADVGIVNEILNALRESRHGDWIDVHNLRVIKYGTDLHIQMHVVLPRWMTVEEQNMEISEVKDSVTELYGDSVDLMLMVDPCTESFCRYCDEECGCRTHSFDGSRDWTVDTVCNEDPKV